MVRVIACPVFPAWPIMFLSNSLTLFPSCPFISTAAQNQNGEHHPPPITLPTLSELCSDNSSKRHRILLCPIHPPTLLHKRDTGTAIITSECLLSTYPPNGNQRKKCVSESCPMGIQQRSESCPMGIQEKTSHLIQ